MDGRHVLLPLRTTELRRSTTGSTAVCSSQATGSAALLSLVDGREEMSAGGGGADFLSTPRPRLSPSLSLLPLFTWAGFSPSHSLVFTLSSQTSQDLPLIPFVPPLPGDRVGTTEPLSHHSAVSPLRNIRFPLQILGEDGGKSCFSPDSFLQFERVVEGHGFNGAEWLMLPGDWRLDTSSRLGNN